jgi:hypothetical protein
MQSGWPAGVQATDLLRVLEQLTERTVRSAAEMP